MRGACGQRDPQGAPRRQGAAAHRCLGLRGQGRARPVPARARARRLVVLLRAATRRRARRLERGRAHQRARSRASTASAVTAVARRPRGGGPRRGRPQRDRRRHPLRRLGLLRAAARRDARAQRRRPGPAAARAARGRLRPVLRPRLDRLRRGPAHRPRARAAVGRGAGRAARSTSTRELDAAREPGAATLEAESRLPAHQRRFVAEAQRDVGPAGGPAVGARAEALRREWVRTELVERGRERARALGWPTRTRSRRRSASGGCWRRSRGRLTIVRPVDRRVGAAHAVPRLDRGPQGRRPDHPRLRAPG